MGKTRLAMIVLAAIVCGMLGFEAFGSSIDARLERARELVYQRKPAEAVAEYRALLSTLDGEDGEGVRKARVVALEALGDLLFLELSDPTGAADAYRRLIAELPRSDEAWAAREKLAEILRLHLDAPLDAIAEWRALAESGRPGAERFQLEAARQYFRMSRYEDARREAEELATRWPDSAQARDASMLAATTLQLEGKADEAIAAYEAIEERYEGTELAARARFHVGQTHASQGDWEGAMISYLEALKTHPEPLKVQAEIARVRKHVAYLRGMQVGNAAAQLRR